MCLGERRVFLGFYTVTIHISSSSHPFPSCRLGGTNGNSLWSQVAVTCPKGTSQRSRQGCSEDLIFNCLCKVRWEEQQNGVAQWLFSSLFNKNCIKMSYPGFPSNKNPLDLHRFSPDHNGGFPNEYYVISTPKKVGKLPINFPHLPRPESRLCLVASAGENGRLRVNMGYLVSGISCEN